MVKHPHSDKVEIEKIPKATTNTPSRRRAHLAQATIPMTSPTPRPQPRRWLGKDDEEIEIDENNIVEAISDILSEKRPHLLMMQRLRSSRYGC